MKAPNIINKYRTERNLTLREFAAELSNGLPEPVSYQTIKNWEDGATKIGYYVMFALAMHTQDWRHDLAVEVLASLRPDIQYANGIQFDVVDVKRLPGPDDAERPIAIDAIFPD